MPKPKLISIIIPAYKQEQTIVKDLARIQKVLTQIRYSFEIIVIVDGRLDKTYQRAKKFASPKLKVYLNKAHQGKGFTVRRGMQKAKGDYIA
ncbi:glycosyltransferase, partial [Microgenomates group bacterium]|nr:glycosyltransferase [Microgenomates group bacterium]